MEQIQFIDLDKLVYWLNDERIHSAAHMFPQKQLMKMKKKDTMRVTTLFTSSKKKEKRNDS